MNPLNASQSELLIQMILVYSNQSEWLKKFNFIQIVSDWPDSGGLKVRINSD